MNTKRIHILLSLVISLALILAACTPAATQAPPAVVETQPAVVETQPAVVETEPPAVIETQPAVETGKLKFGFLAGVQDPFYFTMQRGAAQAAADLGVELVVQIPNNWNATVQTPILEAMVARGDLDFLFLAPVDKEAMVAPLQAAYDSGLPLLTNDTFIGDGDYANGPVTFPLSYIGSDNVLGGVIACNALAEAIGGAGKVYIQNVKPGISTTDQREEGCKQALEGYPDIELVGVDYNDDDPSKAQAQVEATLQRVPDLAGIFGTNVFSAQGAGTVVQNQGLGEQVQVVAFDATETAIEQLRSGVVDLVIAQKPYDMGYFAVAMGLAYLDGVTSIPKRIPTGYQVITRDNVDDPEVAQYIYTAGTSEAEAKSPGRKIGFLAGVQDPFYFTMQRGAQLAADRFGNELVVQIPDNWNATVQTPILEAMVARGDLDFLFLAPVDKEAMVAPLQAAIDSGLPLLTNDTFIGDGDYVNGPVTFPLSYIGSDNVLGGVIACNALAEAIGGAGKVYIQNVKPGISTTDQREEGCKKALEGYPDIELVGVDYNDDDPSKAQAQVEATLQRVPDLAGIFGTNVFSAQGAGTVVQNQGLGEQVSVVAFDATETAIEQLRSGVVDLVIAQIPADMGYFAVIMANAYLNGVASIPKRIPTGYQVITRDNVDDPEVAKFIYTK
ncbi:MAG TPA: substrate-binding domain-containing protein [Anaerolineales bacterium]|nr:substrate-binding domain-containing protein [Anaerolineales bacterium]